MSLGRPNWSDSALFGSPRTRISLLLPTVLVPERLLNELLASVTADVRQLGCVPWRGMICAIEGPTEQPRSCFALMELAHKDPRVCLFAPPTAGTNGRGRGVQRLLAAATGITWPRSASASRPICSF